MVKNTSAEKKKRVIDLGVRGNGREVKILDLATELQGGSRATFILVAAMQAARKLIRENGREIPREETEPTS